MGSSAGQAGMDPALSFQKGLLPPLVWRGVSWMVKPITGTTVQCKGASHKDKWLKNVKVTCHPQEFFPLDPLGATWP